MSHPSVSVVIPMYNDAEVVSEALDSVFAQTHQPSEIIVIDDGSSDDSASVVSGLGRDLTLLKQKNAGPAAARNAGINAASSEWIAFLDADDVWLEDRLASQLSVLTENPELDLLCSGICRYQDGVPERPNESGQLKVLSLNSFVHGNPVAKPATARWHFDSEKGTGKQERCG